MIEFFSELDGEYHCSFGGDTFTAVAMAQKAGVTCAYLTLFGDDIFTDFLTEKMRETRVSLEPSEKREGQNGVYFIAVDGRGERRFQYYRSGSAASTLAISDLSDSLLQRAQLFYSSGVTSAISLSAREAVHSAMDRASRWQIKTAYDLNYRARLWSLESAVDDLKKLLPHLSVVFLSEAEIPLLRLALSGASSGALETDQDLDRLVRDVWKIGASEVVIKLGDRGVIVGDRERGAIERIAALKIMPIDTTGAGDVFNGAYLARRLKNRSALDSARWATAAAGLQVTHRGSVSALPSIPDIDQAFHQLCKVPS